MNIGDIVLITDSFGGGEPYIGHIAVFDGAYEVDIKGVNYYSRVKFLNKEGIIICNCTPATDLIKALA